jgi:hypothetical protein
VILPPGSEPTKQKHGMFGRFMGRNGNGSSSAAAAAAEQNGPYGAVDSMTGETNDIPSTPPPVVPARGGEVYAVKR